jgi:hypothetical protein
MLYNSLDHFLTVHEPDITKLMENAQRAAGGRYTGMTAIQIAESAHAATQRFVKTLRSGQLDSETAQQIAQQMNTAEIAPDDLIQMVNEMEVCFIAYVEAQLRGQPEMGLDLLRRLRHINSRLRTRITAAKLDQAIGRLQKPL